MVGSADATDGMEAGVVPEEGIEVRGLLARLIRYHRHSIFMFGF